MLLLKKEKNTQTKTEQNTDITLGLQNYTFPGRRNEGRWSKGKLKWGPMDVKMLGKRVNIGE